MLRREALLLLRVAVCLLRVSLLWVTLLRVALLRITLLRISLLGVSLLRVSLLRIAWLLPWLLPLLLPVPASLRGLLVRSLDGVRHLPAVVEDTLAGRNRAAHSHQRCLQAY